MNTAILKENLELKRKLADAVQIEVEAKLDIDKKYASMKSQQKALQNQVAVLTEVRNDLANRLSKYERLSKKDFRSK